MEHTDLELYIQIRDGQPHEHPIFADNFRQAFPDIDTENLPDTCAKVIRVDQPAIGTYEVYEGVSYQWVDGVVKDVHSVRAMTDEERAEKTAAHEAWVLESVDPITPAFPRFPIKDESGSWVVPVS